MGMIYDLDELKQKRDFAQKNVLKIKTGLAKETEKLAQYDMEITKAEVTVEMGGEAEFDIEMLKTGRKSIVTNLEAIEGCVADEEETLIKCEKDISAAEAILGAHGKSLLCQSADDHDWEVLEIFPLSGNWKQRRCRRCESIQRLGHS